MAIFSIWTVTHRYADFDVQVQAVLGDKSDQRFAYAERFLLGLFEQGLPPTPATAAPIVNEP